MSIVDFPSTDQLTEVGKAVAPWLTGGLAGALLTFFLHRLTTRRSEPRLWSEVSSVTFSVSGESLLKDRLSVSYDGERYDNLVLYKYTIANRSLKKAEDVLAIFKFASDVNFVTEMTITRHPVPRSHTPAKSDLPPNITEVSLGIIHPGDSVEFEVLADGPEQLEVVIRSKEDTAVSKSKDGSVGNLTSPERIVRDLAFLYALFVTASFVPMFGRLLQGLLVVVATPTLLNVYRHISLLLKSIRRDVTVNVNSMEVHNSGTGIQIPSDRIRDRSGAPGDR